MALCDKRSIWFTAVMRELDSSTILAAASTAIGALVILSVRAASVVEICVNTEENGEEEEETAVIVTATTMMITIALR